MHEKVDGDDMPFYDVVDGARVLFFDRLRGPSKCIGIHGFDKNLKRWELLEGIKENFDSLSLDIWERGKFEFIPELRRWELVEGVKCNNKEGKKIRAKWLYDPKEKKMKGVKVVKKCGYWKCERNSNSESSKRIFKLCGKCQKSFYCSRRHQRNDWVEHKYVCSYY